MFAVGRERWIAAGGITCLFVNAEKSTLANWTPEKISDGKRWVQIWKEAGPVLEAIRRRELRQLDPVRALAALCGPADYHSPLRAPAPTSGLIQQQRWFAKARVCD